MFSYLRPRSRHGALNNVDSEPSNDQNDMRNPPPRFPVPEPPIEEPYRSVVSAAPPVLPPIPRVASIYGAPRTLASLEIASASTSAIGSGGSMPDSSITTKAPVNQRSTQVHTESSTNNPPLSSNFSRPFKSPSVDESANDSPMSAIQANQHTADQQSGLPSQPQRPLAQDTQHIPRHKHQSSRDAFSRAITSPPMPVTVPETHRFSRSQQAAPLPKRPRMPFQDDMPESDESSKPVVPSADATHLQLKPRNQPPDLPEQSWNQQPLPAAVKAQAMPVRPISSSMEGNAQDQQSAVQKQARIRLSMAPNNPQRSSRFTRLNPMSLLARRRSSQPQDAEENDNYKQNALLGNTLANEKDFRIRGNKVHDFSIPRPRRITLNQDVSSTSVAKNFDPSIASSRTMRLSESDSNATAIDKQYSVASRPEAERQHTPVFKEHFEDDTDAWRFDQDDLRNKNTTGIADRLPPEDEDSDSDPSSLPPFARKFPEQVRDPLLLSDPTFALLPSSVTPPPLSDFRPKAASPVPPPKSTLDASPSVTPPKSRSHTPSASTSPSQNADLPRHYKSNASRFSFDMAGFGSAVQEKLLEDKHRQKIARKAHMSKSSQLSVPETDDGFDSDEIDFDDGLEEDIPGMNADDDDDEFLVAAKSVADSSLEDGSNTTKGRFKAIAPMSQLYSHQNINLSTSMSSNLEKTTGDKVEAERKDNKDGESTPQQSLQKTTAHHAVKIDDDFYFDDGDIDDADLQSGSDFDETVFDDEENRVYGQPQRDLEPLSAVPEDESEESSRQSTRPISLESGFAAGQNAAATADTSRTSVQPPEKVVAGKRASTLRQDHTASFLDNKSGLTQDNLAAYHDALAFATQKAASEGRFERKSSMDDPNQAGSNVRESIRVSFSDQPHTKYTEMPDFENGNIMGFDDYEQDDDDIVAAANAEALENDDEGFYGREFGFYAESNGATEAEYANGGYFGPAGMNEIKRSHSGRVNGQEPSLTPITERSEWSQRNSMISLAMHNGHSSFPAALQTPGLAQIADSIQNGEDDMSVADDVATLMKLRQKWGGSSASLHSSGGSAKGASPPGTSSQMMMPPPPRSGNGQTRAKAEKLQPLKLSLQDGITIPPPPLSAGSDSSPIRRSVIKGHSPVKGHSRNSSGADSVTYIKEKDEDGSRWVLERRRTGEDGQVEVLGRQVVEGGRI